MDSQQLPPNNACLNALVDFQISPTACLPISKPFPLIACYLHHTNAISAFMLILFFEFIFLIASPIKAQALNFSSNPVDALLIFILPLIY